MEDAGHCSVKKQALDTGMKEESWIVLLAIINIYQEECEAQNSQTWMDERRRKKKDRHFSGS